MRLEDYAIHVTPHAFYEWNGELDAAISEASALCVGVDAEAEITAEIRSEIAAMLDLLDAA